ncbi:MAG: polyvinyl alcohol dehydrogenase [Gemmatales bacterium]|nr:MAG: polyvinyl alcohol dehydrogenase [Gemmatales bacterium]
MRRWCMLAVVVLIFWQSRASSQTEWPQFRGPNRDGISPDKGLLKKWPEGGPRLIWKATGLGSGYSSVAVAGGKVFSLGNTKGKTYLCAFSQKDGKKLWATEVGPQGGNLGSTPTVDGDRVYAVGQEGDLICAKTADGELVWRVNFKRDFGGACGGWRFTESPLIDGDKLVCTPGGKDAGIVALDKLTGKVIWKCAIPVQQTRAGYASIMIAQQQGIKIYVQLMAAGVVGVRASDGKFLWIYDKLGRNTANIPNPIVLGDYLFCSAGYGKGAALLKLTAQGDSVTFDEVYFNRELTNKHGGLLVVGDYVYGDRDDSGRPQCAEVKTGRIVWRKQDRGPGTGSAAMTYADGHLYVRFQNGVMALVPATPNGYTEVSTFKIPGSRGRSWAHPVVIGGRLYLREQDTILCYDVKAK